MKFRMEFPGSHLNLVLYPTYQYNRNSLLQASAEGKDAIILVCQHKLVTVFSDLCKLRSAYVLRFNKKK